MNKKFFKYILSFVLLYGVAFLLIHNTYVGKKNDYLEVITNKFVQNYDALYHEYKSIAEVVFLTKVNKEEIKNIFIKGNSSDENIKNKARKDLYEVLIKTYKLMEPYHIKQLQFYLPNNESFLRFNSPKHFGDNLTKFRDTVVYVNKNKKAIDGFEDGRVVCGYRFIFPLFIESKYIGCVGISFGSLPFVNDFIKKYKVLANLNIFKKILNSKVFKNEKSNYIASVFKEFYLDKQCTNNNKNFNSFSSLKIPSIQSQQSVTNFITNNKKAYSLIDKKQEIVLTFIKIKNPITKNVNAIFTIGSDIKYINSIYQHHVMMLIISFLVLGFIMYLIYTEYYKKELLDKSLQKIKFSEGYLKAIEDASPNIIISAIQDSISTGNKAFLDFTGYKSIEDFKKKYNCICDLFLERKGYLQKLKNSKDWFTYMEDNPDIQHKVIMLKDGKEHIFLINANRLHIDSEYRSTATLIDITEIENLKNRYEIAINGTQDGLWDWDLITNEIYFSPQFKKQLGYEDDELKNEFKTWEDRVHPDDKDKAVQDYTANMEGKTEVYENRHRLRHKNGSWVWVLDRGKTIFDENKKPIRMVGFHTDITKEYESNQEIMKLQSAFEKSPISIIMTDVNANITYVNPNWCKVTGYSKDEVMGKNPRFLKSGDTSDSGYEEMWKHLTKGEIWSGDIRNIAKDGSEFWEESTIFSSYDGLGKINGYIGFKKEITKEKELSNKLREQENMMIAQSRNAAMGEMISMIAHQWRQPLAVISMDANTILADIELEMVNNDTLIDVSNEIINQTQELTKVIDDFKDFFKPVKHSEFITVLSVANNALNIIGKSLINNNVECIIDNNSTLEIELYSRELMQVFINIINNAKEVLTQNDKNNNKDKKITISINDIRNNVVITIADNGGGIDDDVIDKIFEPYFSTKKEKNGTGLGLYMSKMIIEKHLYGTLKVYNNNDGAVFEITLQQKIENKESK